MVVTGCCVCHFFLIGVNRSIGIVFVLLQERFEASATDAALAASIFVSVRAFGGKHTFTARRPAYGVEQRFYSAMLWHA